MELISVIGLGYVGLPVAVGMARAHGKILGFDINNVRIESLQNGYDSTGEVRESELRQVDIHYTCNVDDLVGSTFFIVSVPTPIDENRQPDLGPLKQACETVGRVLQKDGIVVLESTVYPGLTEEVCAEIIGRASGLIPFVEFGMGYSPERINPGDREHRLENVVKIISANDPATLSRVEAVYKPVIKAGVYKAPSIKVAEAAKVIENTQRDLNIAMMNELALIFDRLGISTREVLDAAATKWNFLNFKPGLVGGHCIGVDPYYLTAKAESLGYHPEVILAGRRINDNMGVFVAQKIVKMLIQADVPVRRARVGILGLAFKENVPDLRNSRVPDIFRELSTFGITPLVHDPMIDPNIALTEYDIEVCSIDLFVELDALVLAVPHDKFLQSGKKVFSTMLTKSGIIMDIKSVLDRESVSIGQTYWSL